METIKDKDFVRLIDKQKINERIQELGEQISKTYKDKDPIILGILNGSFMFLSDILKTLQFSCQVSFLKLQSYQKMSSTEKVRQVLGLQEDIKGRHVIIVEDIVDTGNTMDWLLTHLKKHKPADIAIATLLFKPKALIKDISIDYCGFEIKNDFVVGYGLDYNGYGRNLPEIYVLKSE